MQRINREQARRYVFDARETPLIEVASGESFEIETYDASTGYFKTESDLAIPGKRPGFDRYPPLANPIGGPVKVAGAEKGDTLVVTIEQITVDDYSWIAVGPNRGPLGDSAKWSDVSTKYTTRIFKHTPGPSGTTRDGVLHFNDRIAWPITPFVVGATLAEVFERAARTGMPTHEVADRMARERIAAGPQRQSRPALEAVPRRAAAG